MAPFAFHSRSDSFPSRSHPLTSLLDEQLSRLRSSESASTSTSLVKKINNLQELHESAAKWLQLPSSRQSLEKDNVDKLLDGSVRLLDLCNSASEALSWARESLQEIQSILRRRQPSNMKLVKEAGKYLSFKKTIIKAISKALKNLKREESKHNVLQEVEAVSSDVLESLLTFVVAGPNSERKNSKFSLVSKLLQNKRVEREEEQVLNEIASTEATLLSLMKGKLNKVQIEKVQAELQNSESCIQDLEEAIEGLSRQLINVRVTLLNVLN